PNVEVSIASGLDPQEHHHQQPNQYERQGGVLPATECDRQGDAGCCHTPICSCVESGSPYLASIHLPSVKVPECAQLRGIEWLRRRLGRCVHNHNLLESIVTS